jgi:hypothetical protein
MARTAVATAQTIWGCRWSRPGYRIGVDELEQSEPIWVCVRGGICKTIPEAKCETCERWEPGTREN